MASAFRGSCGPDRHFLPGARSSSRGMDCPSTSDSPQPAVFVAGVIDDKIDDQPHMRFLIPASDSSKSAMVPNSTITFRLASPPLLKGGLNPGAVLDATPIASIVRAIGELPLSGRSVSDDRNRLS